MDICQKFAKARILNAKRSFPEAGHFFVVFLLLGLVSVSVNEFIHILATVLPCCFSISLSE